MRVAFLVSDLASTGGIPHYLNGLVDAVSAFADVGVVTFELGAASRAAAGLSSVRELRGLHPDLVVVGHVGLGVVGVPLALSLRARSAVLAYGVEVWGNTRRSAPLVFSAASEVWPISEFTASEVRRLAPRAFVSQSLGARIREEFFHSPVLEPQVTRRPDGALRIVAVARLDDIQYKGLDTVIESVAQASKERPVELQILGEGVERQRLQTLAKNLPPGICRLRGRVTFPELLAVYNWADINLLLTRFRRETPAYGEGLGLTVLEAAACGTPSIVSSCAGGLETVVDGVTGFHVSEGDVAATAEILIRASVDELAQRGARARAAVRNRHSSQSFDERVRLLLGVDR